MDPVGLHELQLFCLLLELLLVLVVGDLQCGNLLLRQLQLPLELPGLLPCFVGGAVRHIQRPEHTGLASPCFGDVGVRLLQLLLVLGQLDVPLLYSLEQVGLSSLRLVPLGHQHVQYFLGLIKGQKSLLLHTQHFHVLADLPSQLRRHKKKIPHFITHVIEHNCTSFLLYSCSTLKQDVRVHTHI